MFIKLNVNVHSKYLCTGCCESRYIIFSFNVWSNFFFFFLDHLVFSLSVFGDFCEHVACCHVWLFATPWAVARQALLSMEYSRQEYWNGWPFHSPGNLPNPGSNRCLLCLLHCRRSHRGGPDSFENSCQLLLSDFLFREWLKGFQSWFKS